MSGDNNVVEGGIAGRLEFVLTDHCAHFILSKNVYPRMEVTQTGYTDKAHVPWSHDRNRERLP